MNKLAKLHLGDFTFQTVHEQSQIKPYTLECIFQQYNAKQQVNL